VGGPLISVLVPTYQGEAHVAETLRSVLAQTHEDLEVVVGDDGSTDGTLDVVREVTAGDPRVRIDAHENIGIFANPIRLLRQAKGPLVKFLLQDDLLAPDALERLAAPMADPGIALATCKRRRIDATGAELPEVQATTAIVGRSGRLDGRTLGSQLLLTQVNRIGELSTVLHRRSALDPDTLWDFPGWAVRGNGDVVVHLKALATGDAWYETDALASFRTHEGQYGSRPEVAIDCTVDWPHLITGARRLGFLPDDAMERDALTAWLRYAGVFHASVADAPTAGDVLDAMAVAIDRLRSLRSGEAAPMTPSWPMCSCRNDGSPAAVGSTSPASRTDAGT
jgi:glycosyltransferase involved in cell wall biosynthesis